MASRAGEAPPRTRADAARVLGLSDAPGVALTARVVREAARRRAMEAHPDRATGSRARFASVMRAREILLGSETGARASTGVGWAESAARRRAENALPKHFRAFFVATGMVLLGVGTFVRPGAESRKAKRSPMVRGALGLPPERESEG